MKAEILFRGKTEDGEWYYGGLYKYNNKKMSIAYTGEDGGEYEADVMPETVGVFTGYRALNYERIFEGDILKSLTGKYILVTDSGYGDWTFIDIQATEYVTGLMSECCQLIVLWIIFMITLTSWKHTD